MNIEVSLSHHKDIETQHKQNSIDVALSIELYQNNVYGLVRELNHENILNNYLYLLEFDKNFLVRQRTQLIKGEDPRAFIYQDQLHVLSWTYVSDDCEIFLFNVNTDQKTVIKNSITKQNGKNWVPYVHNHGLYFIYSLYPLIIFEYDGTGSVRLVYNQVTLSELDQHGWGAGFTHLRGGTKGIVNNNVVYLFSRTGSPGPHIIHITAIDLTTYTKKSICLEPNRTSGIHDPYGWCQLDGQWYLSTTESETNWFQQNQQFTNKIFKLSGFNI